jgi:hypothetical protein
VNFGNEKELLNLFTMEHGVEAWGPERRLQENDKIHNMSCKNVMNVHRLVANNKSK